MPTAYGVRHSAALTAVILALLAAAPAGDARAAGQPRWPEHIATNYEMFTPAGNRAVRHVVWRASRMLRAGKPRRVVMARVKRMYIAVEDDKRFEEAFDTAVCEAFADELDRWLVAAGYRRIDAFDEFRF